MVKVVEPKEQTLYDVLFGALGLTGLLTVIAVLAALVFAGVLFWVRSRADRDATTQETAHITREDPKRR